jgi:hypothetical protein
MGALSCPKTPETASTGRDLGRPTTASYSFSRSTARSGIVQIKPAGSALIPPTEIIPPSSSPDTPGTMAAPPSDSNTMLSEGSDAG